ncbi:MY18A protein, partial [Pseudoatta argentina]
MPRSRDEVDNMSLDAHHLLHRSCRGKAHASGIAKQNNRQGFPSQKILKSPAQDFSKQHEFSNGVVLDRKHSRHSTSSWECSDSDSMHSSEIGQNGCPENRLTNSNRFLERTLSVKSNAKKKIKGSHGNYQYSPSLRATKGFKKESWADSLRVGCMDDRIKRMEKGWDDSNVIRTPKERKWHRITAEIEQKIPSMDNGIRMFSFKSSWANNSKKVSKRSRSGHQRCAKPIQDIIEWEELFEMALARKIRRKIRENGKVESSIMKNVKRDGESDRAKDEGECMKRLEVLLENKVMPQTDEARSEEHLAQEQAWLTSERIWLLHRGGFTPASKCGSTDPDTGKLRIRLTISGEELLVDEEDVEKANPPQFDKAEELSQLRFLNESSVLHTLRQRYASNLIHTYAGDSMIVINPVAPLAIYSEKVAHMFRGCKSEDMPPHIYAIAQSAYRGMLATRRDHSLVFLGRSGAGKTTNFKHALHYLVLAAGTILTIEKLNALFTVLEAFGNSRTHMNSNATRFTQLFSLDFDQSGQIASASLQVLLLEKSRIGRRANGDPTFHAVYRLLAGAEGALRKELHLTNLVAENNPFVTPLQKHEDKQRAMVEFNRIVAAFRILGISEADEKVIWLVLAGIYHLSCAGAVKAGTSSQSKWQFARVECAEKAANLLGTTVEELSRVVFSVNGGGAGTPSTPRPALRTPSPTEQGKDVTGLDALEGLLIGLYSEVFHCVAALINKSISSAIHTVSSLLLCDAPGFQNLASCGRQTGATFEDLCHNYLQERLQLLFHHTTLVAPKDRYVQEGIDVDYEDDYDEEGIGSPQGLVSLLDRGSSQSATMLRTSQSDLSGGRQMERKGLLWLLDEETVCPGGSDETFLDRLFSHYGDRDHQMLLRKAPGNNQFVLQHLLGTNPVLYTATGWLKATRENPVAKSAITILQESTREHVSMLFVSARGAGVSGALCSSMPGLEGSQSLRRASSIRRTFTAVKRKNICLQVKFTVDGLVETLRRTRVKFVHCLLPQHNAGCTDNKSLLSVKSNQSEDNVINVPLLRSQIRGSQIIDAVRLHKVGFPKHVALGEFRRRFGLLSSDVNARPGSPVADERRAVEDMLLTVDVDPASYRVGQSQQGTRRYVFECTRFMHVLVTHHLHGGDAMEGRAPDAERAFRHNATTVQPLLYSSVRG